VILAERYGSPVFRQIDSACPFEVIMNSTRDGGWVHDEATYIEDAEWEFLRR
jgi:hypothetical protein